MEEERFPHSGKPLHWQGDQLGLRRSLRGLEEGRTAGLWQAGQRDPSAGGPGHRAALPNPSHASTGAHGG